MKKANGQGSLRYDAERKRYELRVTIDGVTEDFRAIPVMGEEHELVEVAPGLFDRARSGEVGTRDTVLARHARRRRVAVVTREGVGEAIERLPAALGARAHRQPAKDAVERGVVHVERWLGSAVDVLVNQDVEEQHPARRPHLGEDVAAPPPPATAQTLSSDALRA